MWEGEIPVSGDEIMLACYILGLHGQVADCLEIWKAKGVDFDAFCYIDIQLAIFAGVNKTLDYLKSETSDEAQAACKYIQECKEAGDFDTIDTYFNPDNLPWFI